MANSFIIHKSIIICLMISCLIFSSKIHKYLTYFLLLPVLIIIAAVIYG
jgi:hypothetical protein